MTYSLGLTLYNLSAPRPDQALLSLRPERPTGRLIWLHAPVAEHVPVMNELARRLRDEDGHVILLTGPAVPAAPAVTIWQPVPADTPAEIRGFLDHWRPDVVVMADGEVRPVAMATLIERAIPVAMVNGRAPHLPRGRSGWWPGLLRGLLRRAPHVWVVDDAAARAFRKAGCPAPGVVVTGRMEEGSAALPAAENDRLALSRLLGTRPVWLAANVPEAEEAAVIAAHRQALRLAHRLLLILVPQDPARLPALAAKMTEGEGWTVANRSSEQEPDPETEVYLAEGDPEYGLWYRLAPITYLGGSLSADGCARNPLEPAALGSAIIHGPRPGPHGVILGRLGAALATRSVAGTQDLTEALGDLLSPDRAARLAQAAWGVASEGAEVTDRVVGLVRQMLGEDT